MSAHSEIAELFWPDSGCARASQTFQYHEPSHYCSYLKLAYYWLPCSAHGLDDQIVAPKVCSRLCHCQYYWTLLELVILVLDSTAQSQTLDLVLTSCQHNWPDGVLDTAVYSCVLPRNLDCISGKSISSSVTCISLSSDEIRTYHCRNIHFMLFTVYSSFFDCTLHDLTPH